MSSRQSTALSIVSSRLVRSLHDSARAASVYFSCGMHDNLQDPVCGPQGLVRSLISQLLRLFDLYLDFIFMLARPLIGKLNLRALCDCFGKLAKQLPAKMVLFCFIDGIFSFESTLWANDTSKAIEDLHDLAYDCDTGAIFKLLVTSSRHSRNVASIFEPESRLRISTRDMPSHDSEREVMLAARRTLPQQTRAMSSLRRTTRPYGDQEIPKHATPKYATEYESASDAGSELSHHEAVL